MISIISPAKSMNFAPYNSPIKSSIPVFWEYSQKLLDAVQNLSEDKIQKIMRVSDKISKLNYERFQNFDTLDTKEAFFAYDGDLYSNIQRDDLIKENIHFANQHIRIISGLYGILKPLDKIKPYRLEMVTKLGQIAHRGLALYWQKAITDYLNRELSEHKNQYLVNLASKEYFAVLDIKHFAYPVIDIEFREIRNGIIKNIAINAKRARGQMVNFMIRHNIDHVNDFKTFDYNGFAFNDKLSNNQRLVFLKK